MNSKNDNENKHFPNSISQIDGQSQMSKIENNQLRKASIHMLTVGKNSFGNSALLGNSALNPLNQMQSNNIIKLNELNQKEKGNEILFFKKKDSHFSSYDLLHIKNNIITKEMNKKRRKKLFKFSYYFFDFVLERFDNSNQCFSNDLYKIVNNYLGKICDITSYIYLVKQFNIFKYVYFNDYDLDIINSRKKININNKDLTNSIKNELKNRRFIIFSKLF